MTEVRQSVQVVCCLKVHATAVAAVAAIRATAWDILFTAKAHTAVAAVPGDNIDASFVYKFHDKRPVLGSAIRELRSAAKFSGIRDATLFE